MKKINLKTSPNELRAVCFAIDYDSPVPQNDDPDRKQKMSWISIFEDVKTKLMTKFVKGVGQEEISFKLHYHEAYTLHQILMELDLNHEGQNFLGQIDQKLA